MSDKGTVRPTNEDHFVVARFGRFLEIAQTNISAQEVPSNSEEVGYGLVVADGLGGQSAGEVASRLAISVLWDLVLMTPDWIPRLEDEASAAEVTRRAKERCAAIHAALVERGQHDPQLAGMATTLTILATAEDTAIITHVGDSRAYLLRCGKLLQLTRDHTWVQELIDQKVLKPEDSSTHRFRHVLTNALGATSNEVEPDVHRLCLFDGDCLLLCTDGLSSYVDESVILQILSAEHSAGGICQRLIDAALQAGGKDNVTVVVGRFRKC